MAGFVSRPVGFMLAGLSSGGCYSACNTCIVKIELFSGVPLVQISRILEGIAMAMQHGSQSRRGLDVA
jgi:hypothetical protein